MTQYKLTVNGKTREVALIERSCNTVSFIIEGECYTVSAEPILSDSRSASPSLENTPSHSTNEAKAPMPGFVVNLLVKVGDKVKKGATLLTIEAMKMENSINSPADGTVKEVKVKAGQEVSQGEVLVVVE